MLLHEKGKPVKALCSQCKRLFQPARAELAAAAKIRGELLVCSPCFKRLLLLLKKAV